jgi:hypothetical protein
MNILSLHIGKKGLYSPQRSKSRKGMAVIGHSEMKHEESTDTTDNSSVTRSDSALSSNLSFSGLNDRLDTQTTAERKRVQWVILYEGLFWMWRYTKKYKKKKISENSEYQPSVAQDVRHMKALIRHMEEHLEYTHTNHIWFKQLYSTIDDTLSVLDCLYLLNILFFSVMS